MKVATMTVFMREAAALHAVYRWPFGCFHLCGVRQVVHACNVIALGVERPAFAGVRSCAPSLAFANAKVRHSFETSIESRLFLSVSQDDSSANRWQEESS